MLSVEALDVELVESLNELMYERNNIHYYIKFHTNNKCFSPFIKLYSELTKLLIFLFRILTTWHFNRMQSE